MNFIQIEGTVTGAFAHRFVIEGEHGKMLIDIGPDANLPIAEGDRISAEGDRKPSEVKVSSITLADGSAHQVKHGQKRPTDGKHAEAAAIKLEVVLEAARSAGYTVDGVVERKPNHFEVSARKGDEPFIIYIGLDGTVEKAEPLTPET